MQKSTRYLVTIILLLAGTLSAHAQQDDISFVVGGHSRAINQLVLAPDGKTAATASDDSTVRIWNVARGTLLGILRGHRGAVHTVAFSPDGKYLASGGADSVVRIWSMSGLDSSRVLDRYPGEITSVAWPEGERIIAGCSDGRISIREYPSGRDLATFIGFSGTVSRVFTSRAGDMIVALGGSGTLDRGSLGDTTRIWSALGDTLLNVIPAVRYNYAAASLSSNGTLALADITTIRLIEPRTARVIDSIELYERVFTMDFNAAGTRLALLSDRRFELYDLATRTILDSSTSGIHYTSLMRSSLVLLPGDSAFLVGGNMSGGGIAQVELPIVEMHSVVTGNLVRDIQGHRTLVTQLAFGNDGASLLSSSDRQVVVVDAETARQSVLEFETGRIVIAVDGGFYATAWSDSEVGFSGRVTIYSVASGAIGLVYQLYQPGIRAVAPDGRSAIYNDGATYLWDSVTGLSTPHHNIGDVYSFDGQRVAGIGDAIIGIWNLHDSDPFMTFHVSSIPWDLAFSRDGSLLACGYANGTITVREVNSGREVRTFAGHTGPVAGVSFSRNGRYIISAGHDSTVRIWSIATGGLEYTYDGYPSAQLSVSISADSKFIASGAADGSVIVWHARGDVADVEPDGNVPSTGSLALYQNVADESVVITGIVDRDASNIRLVDLLGRVVRRFEGRPVGGRAELDVAGIGSGVYLVVIGGKALPVRIGR